MAPTKKYLNKENKYNTVCFSGDKKPMENMIKDAREKKHGFYCVVEELMKFFERLAKLDTTLKAVIGLDEVVVCANLPTVRKVPTEFIFLGRTDPTPFKVSLASRNPFQLVFRYPAIVFMPLVSFFDLIIRKGRHPFISQLNESEYLP